MGTSIFDFEEERLAKEIRKHKAKRVLIQLPEGLKPYALSIATTVESVGVQALVSADPCYGACDLAVYDAQALQADLIVHYGHTEMIKQPAIPAVYFETRTNIDIKAAVKRALPLLEPWNSIGLVTTVQHVHEIGKAKDVLLGERKRVVIGDAGRLRYAGQIIGCDYSNAKIMTDQIDAFLFVGSGKFHAMGISLATSKPTIVADPYEERAFSVEGEAEKTRRQRMTNVSEAKRAQIFGIIVGLKPGQTRLQRAVEIKNKLQDKGRKTVVFALKEITPEALMQFPTIDAFVNTACPRIVLDDAPRFSRPMLTINEALVTIEEMDWETLCKKGWFEN
ncbi:MAG TPA: diphthamide biosynthesis enzyme Dph2 [Candidatus Krumholzibacteriaceae bacterium]|nr:diphthamide biosynthesis enzyme Dph2 [Candidatus Krumholzibacteriaceae bacterium]